MTLVTYDDSDIGAMAKVIMAIDDDKVHAWLLSILTIWFDREGFDPYKDTVGPGIYGGIVKRDENGEVGWMMVIEMTMMLEMLEMKMN